MVLLSLSSAASYSLYFANESINRGAKENFYLLAINPRKVSNIGEHIHKEVGYSGKNESNAQASEEFVASSARPEDIYGARKLNKDGSIEPLIFNKNVLKEGRSFVGDKEFIKFAAFNHIDEYMIAECIEQPKVFEKIYEPHKVNEIKQKIEQMKINNPERFEEIKAIAEMKHPNDHRRDFHNKNSNDKESHEKRYIERKKGVIDDILSEIGKKYGIKIISNHSRNSSIVDISDVNLSGISPGSDNNDNKNKSFVNSLEQQNQQNSSKGLS